MLQLRARRSRASARHVARVEAAVAAYAPDLWAATAPRLARWVRRVLARLESALQVRAIAENPEQILLAQLIASLSLEDGPVPDELLKAVEVLPADAGISSGFLPTDPRRALITRETRQLLESDLGDYWRTLTDPTRLSRRITARRAEGMTGQALVTAIATEYRSGYFAAERLVRTSYGTGANLAQYEALRAAGYTRVRWLTAQDARVRRAGRTPFDHVRMNGRTVEIGQPFVTPAGSRLLYPLDRSLNAPKGEVINCRCSTVGVDAPDS